MNVNGVMTKKMLAALVESLNDAPQCQYVVDISLQQPPQEDKPPATTKKRVYLTDEQKKDLYDQFRQGFALGDLAKAFDVHESTAKKIIGQQNKATLEEQEAKRAAEAKMQESPLA